MIKIKKITFLCIFLLFSILSYGNLILELSNSEIYKEQNFELRIIFENIHREDFQIKGIENFQILSQGTSSNVSLVNGKRTQRLTQTYRLRPKEVGEFTLKAISDNYESNIGKIKITNIKPKGNEELFKTFREIEKRDYFFGEKILLKEGIKSKINLNRMSYVSKEDIKNARVQNISQGRIKSETKNIDGVPHLIATSYYALIDPLTSGKITIPSNTIRLAYEEVNNDFFRSRQSKEEFLSFEELNLNVLPLPAYDGPKTYTGLVGEIEIETKVNKKNIELGEAINLKVRLKGHANLELVDKIFHSPIEGFRIFENPLEIKEEIVNNRYYAEKEFEIILVPLDEQVKRIPDIIIPYFDPFKKEYKTAISRGEKINVIGTSLNINHENNTRKDKELIKINTINQISEKKYNKHLINLIIFQFFLIFFLIFLLFKDKIRGVKNEKNSKYYISKINKAKNTREIYDLLNLLLKEEYNISLGSIGLNNLKNNNTIPKELIEILIKLEEDLYGNLKVNNDFKKELVNILKRW